MDEKKFENVVLDVIEAKSATQQKSHIRSLISCLLCKASSNSFKVAIWPF